MRRPARRRAGAAVLAVCAVVCGCAAPVPPMYEWGTFARLQYETLLRRGADPNQQISQMQMHAMKVEADRRPLPPGFRAHLGLLQLQVGRTDEARSLWLSEKAAFPESAPYIDQLLKKLDPAAVTPEPKENPA